jgi:hypothetical protein
MHDGTLAPGDGADWLAAYKTAYEDNLKRVPEFAAWLQSDYVPIAGGWQY